MKKMMVLTLCCVFLMFLSWSFPGCNGGPDPTLDPTPTPTPGAEPTPTPGADEAADKVFLLHHSVGEGLVTEGHMRATFGTYNTAHTARFEFWDHGYNADGLRDQAGNPTGTNYEIPDDNTDPEGLYRLWTDTSTGWTHPRTTILAGYKVIAFKSCFPASAIPDAATLQQYKDWYLAMRDFFDTRTDRVFVVISTPPLHRLATNATEAANARAFANWLSSSTYLSGHPNVVCFNLFDHLAQADDGSATANMLRYDYEASHTDSDSHPNTLANETVGPVLAQFLIDAAVAH